MAVIPFGDTLCFNLTKDGGLGSLMTAMPRGGACTEGAIRLQVVDLDVGLLYFFALAGTGIVGAALAGWASDNKYSLLGGVRAASQMVSYEVTMGLTLVGAVMVYGTLRVRQDDRVAVAERLGHLRAAGRLLPVFHGVRRRIEAHPVRHSGRRE